MSQMRLYRKALADAIHRPMGVIPDSASGLVDHADLAAAEGRRSPAPPAAPVDSTDLVERLRAGIQWRAEILTTGGTELMRDYEATEALMREAAQRIKELEHVTAQVISELGRTTSGNNWRAEQIEESCQQMLAALEILQGQQAPPAEVIHMTAKTGIENTGDSNAVSVGVSDLLSSPLTHLVVLHRVLYGTIDENSALEYLHSHLREDADLADMGRPLKYQYKDNAPVSGRAKDRKT